MSRNLTAEPNWLPYLDLACVTAAGAAWYALPQAGPWPLVVALAPWVVRFARTGQPSRHTAFDLPLLLFVVTAGVAVWSAYDRQAAWPKFWQIVGGVLVFYALANAEPIGDGRAWLLAAFGTAVAVYFLATHNWDTYPAKIAALTGVGRALQAPLPELPGHRLHPNVAGGLMAMMLPFAGLTVIKAGQRLGRAAPSQRARRVLVLAVALTMAAVTGFGLLMTTSRSAWIALGGALLLVGLWLIAGGLARLTAVRRGWAFVGLAGAGLAAALAAVFVLPGGAAAALAAIPGGETGVGRMNLLRYTPTLVRDYPFIGAGLGGFMMLYSTYALLIHVGYTVHSHNLYLNVAVEQGLVALAALVWMWLLFAAAVWRGILRPGAGRGAGVLGAAALSLVVALAHSLADDVLYGSRGLLVMFVPLAFAVPYLTSRQRAGGRWAGWAVPVAITAVLLLALAWRDGLLSRVYSNLGAVHQSRAELGIYAWPEYPLQDDVRRRVNLAGPVAEFERALAYDPGNSSANRRLGMIELALGQYEAALEHLQAAYAADRGSITARQLLGEALIANGRVEEGRALWATVDNEQRQLEIRAFWYDYIGDSRRAAWMQQAAAGQ